jgi:hypothetical protein
MKTNWIGTMKKIRLLALSLVLTVAAAGYVLPPSFFGQIPLRGESSLGLLVGEDDGFACAIFYGSDIEGNLEPCG